VVALAVHEDGQLADVLECRGHVQAWWRRKFRRTGRGYRSDVAAAKHFAEVFRYVMRPERREW
jgi:hypothetical protein